MTWKDLTKKVQNTVNQIAMDEVLDAVKEVEQKHIQEEVYDAYNPIAYKRRYYDNGLIADDNIVGELNGNTLEVRNTTQPNASISKPPTPYNSSDITQFSKWIEFGETYNGNAKLLFDGNRSDEPWANPRPFTANTIEDLKQNKQHIKALKEGLKKRNIKTK